jgi:hypothetical protein
MLRREDRSMRMSDYVDDVMTVFDKWRELVGLSEQRASFYIFNGGSRAASIRAGTVNIGYKTLDNAMQALSDRWPPGHDRDWPKASTGLRGPSISDQMRWLRVELRLTCVIA